VPRLPTFALNGPLWDTWSSGESVLKTLMALMGSN
jgi:hypothetical protein